MSSELSYLLTRLTLSPKPNRWSHDSISTNQQAACSRSYDKIIRAVYSNKSPGQVVNYNICISFALLQWMHVEFLRGEMETVKNATQLSSFAIQADVVS